MLWTIEQYESVREKEETLQDLELHWRRMFKQPCSLAGADTKPNRQLQKTEPEWEWVSSLWDWCRHIALDHIHLSIRSSYCIATTTSPAFSWSKSVNCAAADSWGKVFCLDKPSQGIETIAFDEHFTWSTQQSSGIPLINLSIESHLSAIWTITYIYIALHGFIWLNSWQMPPLPKDKNKR